MRLDAERLALLDGDQPSLVRRGPRYRTLPLLAQMRRADRVRKCLLLRVDRRCGGHHETDASGPKTDVADPLTHRVGGGGEDRQ
jgi:hypothetical protein